MKAIIIPILLGAFGAGFIIGDLWNKWKVHKRTGLSVDSLMVELLQIAKGWWNEMPIQDIYGSGLGNANLVMKYYPSRKSYKDVSEYEILQIYLREGGKVECSEYINPKIDD